MALANDSKTMSPNIGIGGSSKDTQVLSRSTGINATSSTPNFGATLTELATTPTALGEIGSQIMQSSAKANAERFGQALGENPRGTLLPSVTDFDKMVAESYAAQAHTTLGLQATDLLNKGSEQLSSLNRITPQAIQSYTTNMAKGLQETIELAPDSLKPQLQAQYGNQLLNATHHFNERMVSQQKSEAASKDSAWRTQQSDAIQNAVKDGNIELAQSMQDSLNANVKAGLASGTISPSEAQTALTTSKLNFESSKSIKTWMDAKKNGTSDEYLKSIADKKIPGLSWSESEAVRNNTVKYAGAEEAAENRNESLFMAQAQQEITMGTFDQDRANFFKENLRPLQYTRMMTQWAASNHSNNSEQIALQAMVSKADDASAYIGATKKQINNTYSQLVQSAMKKSQVSGNPITQQDAEYQAAAFMATPVPDVVESINRGLKNGNASQALNSIQMFERLHSLEGNKTIGVDESAKAVGEIFQDFLASNPGNPEGALQLAKEAVFNKDEKTLKLNNLKISEYYQRNAPDAAHGFSNAVNISGIGGNGTNIDNPAGFTADINSRFNGYMQLTNGDVDQSKKLVARDAAKIWGETEANGKKEITRLPIESIIHIKKGAKSLIQQDIHEQLAPQLIESERAHSEGKLPYYWRMKQGRPSYDDYAKAKAEIEEKMGFGGIARNSRNNSNDAAEFSGEDSSFAVLRKSLSEQRKIVKSFEEGKPIEIEQVFNDKTTKTYHVNVQTSNWAAISPKTGRVEGGSNIMAVDPETGIRTALTGYYGSTKTQPQYSPNSALIQSRYLSVNGLSPQTPEDFIAQYDREAMIREQVKSFPYARGAF